MKDLLRYLKERDAREELERWLAAHNYTDPAHPKFALNTRTRQLVVKDAPVDIPSRTPLVVFAAIPEPHWSQVYSTADDTIWQWLNPAIRRYEPDRSNPFLRADPKAALLGVIVREPGWNSNDAPAHSYVAVERSGIIEMGLGSRACHMVQDGLVFGLTPIVGYFWQFLGFVADFSIAFKQMSHLLVVACLRGTREAYLGSLARGWREPLDPLFPHNPQCPEPGIAIRFAGIGPEIDDVGVASLACDFATRIENAWGQRMPRCYVSADVDPATPFDRRVFGAAAC